MIRLVDLLLLGLFFALSALFSGMETGAYLVSRVRVREQARRGIRRAERLQRLLGGTNRLVFALLIANNAANYLLAHRMTHVYLQAGWGEAGSREWAGLSWNAEVMATLTLMLPLFFLGELVPKNLFRQYADRLMMVFSGYAAWTQRLLYPLTSPLLWLFRRWVPDESRRGAEAGFSLSLQGVHDYVAEAESLTEANDQRQELIRNLTGLHRMAVRDVMQPLAVETILPYNATVAEAIQRMRESGSERLLVCRGSIRRSVGWVDLLDLLDPEMDPGRPAHQIAHKPIRLAETLGLADAARRLQNSDPECSALVTGSNGRTTGSLSLLDIIAFVVRGEPSSEHDGFLTAAALRGTLKVDEKARNPIAPGRPRR